MRRLRLVLVLCGAVAGLAPADGRGADGGRLWFRAAAAEAGLDVVTYTGGAEKNHILESTGNGVLLFDYDLDGDLDVYFVNGCRFLPGGVLEPHTSVLYRNRGDGTFEDATAAAGVGTSLYGQGGAVGDVDGDGLPDLYVTAFGANRLFRNNGDGTFTEGAAAAGVADPRWSIGASFFDADGDGDADLFVANYIETSWEEVRRARRTRLWRGRVEVLDGPRGLTPSRNAFYRNRGDGTFAEETAAAGLAAREPGYSMGVATLDVDGDGDTDLFVANDSTPNALFRNRGDGTFEEVGAETGAAYGADGKTQGSMGVDAGDLDGDGWPEIVVTNFAHDYYTLYRNLGGRMLLDDSFRAGIAVDTFVPLGWGTFFFDGDGDGDLDVFFANGHIYPQVDEDPALNESFRQRNLLFRNDDGVLTNVSAEAGDAFDEERSSRGAAFGDLDGDGDPDIVVSNQDEPPSLLRNEGASGRWVAVRLVDPVGERDALGARVTIEAGGRSQWTELASGGSYASESERVARFAVGEAARIERLRIRWPDGTVEEHRDLDAAPLVVVKRGAAPWIVR